MNRLHDEFKNDKSRKFTFNFIYSHKIDCWTVCEVCVYSLIEPRFFINVVFACLYVKCP